MLLWVVGFELVVFQTGRHVVAGGDEFAPLVEIAAGDDRIVNDQHVVQLRAKTGRRPVRAARQHAAGVAMRIAFDDEFVVYAGRGSAVMRQIAVLHVKSGRCELVRHRRPGRAAVPKKNVAAAAKGLQRIHQLLVVHFIDGGVDGAAAAIGVAQEAEDFVQRVARKIEPGLEPRRLQLLQKVSQRRIADIAVDEAADDLGHQGPTIEIGCQAAPGVAGGDQRRRPVRHGICVGCKGTVRRVFHRRNPI